MPRNMNAINAFAESVGQPIDLMVVPSAGWASGEADYTDADALARIAQKADSGVRMLPVQQIFEGRPELYYNTDHHWTSRGAYDAYACYMNALGRDLRTSYSVTTVDGFRGSTYARSALWLTPAESMELWQGSEGLTVTNGETEGAHTGIFYEERLTSADMYTVFLDGNHSLVRVKIPERRESFWSSGIPTETAWAASWRKAMGRSCWSICAITAARYRSWCARSSLTISSFATTV